MIEDEAQSAWNVCYECDILEGRMKRKTRKLKNNEYKCGICHQIFIKGRSDEEAWDEFKQCYPTIPEDETGLVCDDCYKLIMKDIEENPWKYPK